MATFCMALSIFATCVIPVLLYGCETLILDYPCLMALRISKLTLANAYLSCLPHHHANDIETVCNGNLCIMYADLLMYPSKLMTSDNHAPKHIAIQLTSD